MIYKFCFFCFYFLVAAVEFTAQNKCIKGRVRQAQNHQPIPDVHIWASRSEQGTITDQSGKFEICLDAHELLIISHAAFVTQRIFIDNNDSITIFLQKKEVITHEVEVKGQRETVLNPALPATSSIQSKDIFRIPMLLGEADVVGALRQLPGIQSVSEGIGGVFVRGGSPGQNSFLLDGMELLNPVHLMGVFSVFNPLITSRAEVFKGHSPVSLRSALSSAISVVSANPLYENQFAKGSIGNIASNLTFALQSKNKKWGVTGGVRRSFLELYREASSLFVDEDNNYFSQSFYRFYDFNGRLVLNHSPGSRFNLSWYMGNDNFSIDNDDVGYDAGTNYSNKALSMQWVKRIGENGLLKVLADYTYTRSDFNGKIIHNPLSFKSWHQKLSLNVEQLKQYRYHTIKYGIGTSNYKTLPQDIYWETLSDTIQSRNIFRNFDITWFVEDTYKPLPKVSLYAGIRGYYYASLGPYKYVDDNYTEEVSAGIIVDHYWLWNSSISLAYAAPRKNHYKIAWTRAVQPRHLAALSTMPLPNDLWMMASPRLKPQLGHQWSVQYEKSRPNYSLMLGVFARIMKNQLLFNMLLDREVLNFEDLFYTGKGRAYGVEFSMNKRAGIFQGAINYTLSKSERSFSDIFNGEWFNDKFDRTHDLTFLINCELSKKWYLSANWTYATGIAMTLPAGRMWIMGSIMNDYDGFNNFRLPPYHRLDISTSFRLKSRTFKESVINFSIINVYNRANPYFLFYHVSKGNNNYDIDIKARQISLFPIMPSLSWKFEF
ncbi:TonB-dependent receptor [Thermophagus xiamenensis]|uniref:Outer membrane receptor proteins, mostly Fe transport n=1 Tax=Thermophagus xiamenensis TaxID=385682 RepID=A0A1I2FPH1_9BACT|nr:TonB-dependent receptor [Thermophagus xiamenensis]SFF06356.1 Outer membrane receptor proteins, mostly Fe transport [Thermophagus xiamenensis]